MTELRDVRHIVPLDILGQTRDFLYQCGLEGNEGMVLWIGRVSGDDVKITRVFVPEQVATRSQFGVAVDLTERAHYTLPDELKSGERFFVRVHSHPRSAFHSARDDANAVITHQGALSIVVPNFAVAPMDLDQCAIYRLEHGKGWMRLSPNAVLRIFEVGP